MAFPLLVPAAVAALLSFAGWAVTHPVLFAQLLSSSRKGQLTLGYLQEVLGADDFVAVLTGALVDYAESKAGLVLDRADPLSDASLSFAIGSKIGIEITSIKDAEGLKGDVARFAQGQIEARSGLALTNILDTDAIRSDMSAFASGKISAHAGVTLTDVLDVDKTKTELTAWALDNFVSHVQTRLAQVVGGVGGSAIDLSGVGAGARQNLKDGLQASEIMSQAFAGLVVVLLDKARRDLNRARRKEQNRQAQRRFRALHGARMRYDRLVPVVDP